MAGQALKDIDQKTEKPPHKPLLIQENRNYKKNRDADRPIYEVLLKRPALEVDDEYKQQN